MRPIHPSAYVIDDRPFAPLEDPPIAVDRPIGEQVGGTDIRCIHICCLCAEAPALVGYENVRTLVDAGNGVQHPRLIVLGRIGVVALGHQATGGERSNLIAITLQDVQRNKKTIMTVGSDAAKPVYTYYLHAVQSVSVKSHT